jgi:hypothetical protein
LRGEDFEYEYLDALRGNRLAWLGNGATVAQEEGRDTTAYLRQVDVPPPIVAGVNVWEDCPGQANGVNGRVDGVAVVNGFDHATTPTKTTVVPTAVEVDGAVGGL